MASDSEDEYLHSEISPGSHYVAGDILGPLKDNLAGTLHFDSFSVLGRLGVDNVDANLVKNCLSHLNANTRFAECKSILLEETKTDHEMLNNRQERLMMDSLHSILEMIRVFRPATFERELVFLGEDSRLKAEGDTFSFPQIIWNLTFCGVLGPRSTTHEVSGDKRLWRRRLAFVGLKASSKKGLVGTEKDPVTDFTAQAADYARLHMSARPFQLFSIGLLIFGNMFCVAIFDRDGVEFSKMEDMWENLELFVRIARRLFCDMTEYELGMDPNVKQLSLNDQISQACRHYAIQNIPQNHRSYNEEVEKLSEYPTYSIEFNGVVHFTIGMPIFSSLSLLGRGTNVWKVTSSPEYISASILIMKSAWRKSERVQESLIHEHVKVLKKRWESQEQQQSGQIPETFGSPEGLVEHLKGGDVSLPDGRKLTTANLRGMSENQEQNTTILHRVFFETIGRQLWEFDNFLELFLGVRAALAGHKFLVDAGVLHRDVHAGNILLSLNSNVPDERKGFLTDFEFARIEDQQMEIQQTITVPSILTPDGTMTAPTTRTHTIKTFVQRGAPMTGTVQFMACELVYAMSENRPIKHDIFHDVESFVWVIYYATLRRLAYVERPLQDVDFSDRETINKLKRSFNGLFGYIDLNQIYIARESASIPISLFGRPLLGLFSAPLSEFYQNLFGYIMTTRLARSNDHLFGQATYDGLLHILDKVITDLRQLPQYSEL